MHGIGLYNVAFFVHSLDCGGVENYLLRFLEYKHSAFNKVFVYCKSGRGGSLEAQYLEFSNVELVKYKHGYFNLLTYRFLYFFLKNSNVNVVCDFTGNFSGFPLMISKFAGVDNRIAFYRSAADAFQQSLFKKLYSKIINCLVLSFSTTILSNSKAAFEYFFKPSWQVDTRFKIILNGLRADEYANTSTDLRSVLNIHKEAFVVGHAGRFNQAKNHGIILKVAKKLMIKYPDIYFLLCGNGVKQNLQSMVTTNDAENRIFLFENRSDIPVFLNTLNCFFFPSIREGQPNALIEAMVMGLPFVASDIPSVRETVGDECILYPPMSVDALATAIEKEYLERRGRDRELQKQMIKRFDYKKRFDEFYKILNP